MTVNAVTDTKKGRTGIAPTYLHTTHSKFWYEFAPMKNSRGSIEKFEYRCTTRNLPLCNGTIIVLKITLLHGVSVITNFVIPKRDIKKQTKKETSHFFVYSRRVTHDPHHTW